MEKVKKFLDNISSQRDSIEKKEKTLLNVTNYNNLMSIVYDNHFRLINDESRTSTLMNAIFDVIQPNDIVADLGAGTGILSFFAAKKAKKVYSVELFPPLSSYGARRRNDKINSIETDARFVKLPEKVDLVICEMLSTALILEPQVAVMNHAIKELLKEGGRVIPISVVTKAQLIHNDYFNNDLEFKLPYYEDDFTRKSQIVLSEEEPYHMINFTKINNLDVNKELKIKATRDGLLNALKITSLAFLTNNIVLRPTFTTLRPYIFPLNDYRIAKGDSVTIKISYKLGYGFDFFNCTVIV